MELRFRHKEVVYLLNARRALSNVNRRGAGFAQEPASRAPPRPHQVSVIVRLKHILQPLGHLPRQQWFNSLVSELALHLPFVESVCPAQVKYL